MLGVLGRFGLVVLLATLGAAPSAHAAITARAALQSEAGATRIVVTLSSKRSVGARARPRAVTITVSGRTYRLARARDARVAAVSLGTWRSTAQRGAAAQRLLAAAGKRAKIRIRSRAGTTTVRSKLAAPAATPRAPGPAPAPAPAPAATPTATPTPAPAPEEMTGQPAIDHMTEALKDGAVKRFRSGPDFSETWELHFCGDGRFRWQHQLNQTGFPPMATEEYGRPWTVVEARVRNDGTYKGARVTGTFTERHTFQGGNETINEPMEALIEFLNGQWYWNGQPVATLTASCDPTF